MADKDDSDHFSDYETDPDSGSDFEVGGETDSESDDGEIMQNPQGPWFRIHPPEIEDGQEFAEDVGPKNVPPENAKPIDYFFLFMTLEFLNKIVRETNRYARELIAGRERIRRCSRLHDWFKVGILTLTELKAFLAVILNMGIVKKPSIAEYWNTRYSSQDTKWFRTVFSRNRFQAILKFFHITDNNTLPNRNSPNYSPAGKFQCIVDLFNTKSKEHYIPCQSISIDESLIGTRGRSSMIQFIPSKAAKFGVKLWVLAEALTGYIYQLKVYRGKNYDPTPRGTLQGSLVVNSLLESAELFNKGYHVITDSFFTSLNLARELIPKRTFLTGTLRKNRPMPHSIKNPTVGENESVFLRQGKILLCAYKETRRRKPVRLLSTRCKAVLNNNGKPKVIDFYNSTMGGVDLADMLVTAYNDDRKTVKVWKKIVFNLIQRMVVNAYILYKQNTPATHVTRLSFMQSLIEDLSQEHIVGRQQSVPRIRPNRVIRVRKLPGGREKDCSGCSERNGWNGRKRTRTICDRCERGLHRACRNNHVCIED